MTIFSSSQPSIRARMLAKFPANVIAGSGMVITKSGGTYTFAATGVVATLADLPDITADRLLGRDTSGVGAVEELTLGAGLGFTGAGGVQLQSNQRVRFISIPLTGAPISTGIKADFLVPFSGTISRVTLMGDQTGSIVIDIWKDTFANYPPTVADTITASAKPTISGGLSYQDAVLTGWNTTITAGDTLRINVDSVATFTRLTLALDVVTV